MSNPYDPAKEPELTLTLDPFAQEVPTMEQPQAQMPAEKKEEPKGLPACPQEEKKEEAGKGGYLRECSEFHQPAEQGNRRH